jgi:hypothetical protein
MSGITDDRMIELMLTEKQALDAYFTSMIQDAAGSSTIRRAPVTGPDWPVRADYPNRAAFRSACAEWRRSR